jgi:hypothetical protein
MQGYRRGKQAPDDPPARPITFKAARKLDVFELARLWADPHAWNLDERTVYDELAELAIMSVLDMKLCEWRPMAIHGAIRAGARPESIALAVGSSLQDAYELWREWADDQCDMVSGNTRGISAEEYDAVEQRFAQAGASLVDTQKRVA